MSAWRISIGTKGSQTNSLSAMHGVRELRRVIMVLPKPLEEEDDDAFERRLLSDPRFLKRVERARPAFREGKGIRIEDIKFDEEK